MAKAKDEIIKPLTWLHAHLRGWIIKKGVGVSLKKPPRLRSVRVFPLKKTQSILVFSLVLA